MTSRAASSAGTRFCPPLWAWLLTLLLLAVFLRLGFWQLDRAAEKEALLADFASAAEAAPSPMPSPAPEAGAAPQRVRVSGHYIAPQLLLDSQSRENRPGVRVWTALRRSGGDIILVDRGWMADLGRQAEARIPLPQGEQTLTGLWRSLPQAGIAVSNRPCEAAGSARRVQYPRHDELRCLYEGALADGLLLLDAGAGDGFLRDWRPERVDPKVHLAYAVQWFGFALALSILFIVVNRKRA